MDLTNHDSMVKSAANKGKPNLVNRRPEELLPKWNPQRVSQAPL